jgi:zinc-finger of transposase IS204/IS1001/IS1096/IS1165
VPVCGVRAVGNGRRRVVVRDLPLADRPVVLVWAKRLWRCPEPACPACTWSEESDQIAPRAVLTERARAEIARRVGPAEHSVAKPPRTSGCHSMQRWQQCAITVDPGSITSPASASRLRSGWMRPRSSPRPLSVRRCW